ncbi:MAG: DUF1549 and DUF1553 domain-containing protein [Abditibacteriales bacterium]|nr:DUF1549 and DUF1553 domain-containing protein [Abditibacteriales bacterium]MDW8364516.1 DUF1549 and DUF1553 domain-containing protein [Abditibacteriales bacterium]
MVRRLCSVIMALTFSALPVRSDASKRSHASNRSCITSPSLVSVAVEPQESVIMGARGRQTFVVVGHYSDGSQKDLTAAAKFRALNEKVATMTANVARPVGDGVTVIKVWVPGNKTAEAKLTVQQADYKPPINFTHDVVPILTKAGCNQGACHGAQYGKGGFKISLLGYEPDVDHNAIVRLSEGRRVNRALPDASLLLRKATMQIPHGGGRRFDKDSYEYQVLREWIAAGCPGPKATDPQVVKLEVFPAERTMSLNDTQRLVVRATYERGIVEDVTHKALLSTNNDGIATVSPDGVVTAVGKGFTAIMVRYQGQANVCRVAVPYAKIDKYPPLPQNNFVDALVIDKWKKLGLLPSDLCTDGEFIRRVYLDTLGKLPDPATVRAFLADPSPDKRQRLIAKVLGPEHASAYADFWTVKWGDLLRNNRNRLNENGMWSFYGWLRESFRRNKPMDQFARELLTAQGSIFSNGPANYFRVASNPPDLAETTSQVFLGVRLQCARCHHHPFEKWSQDDYYGLAAFFATLRTRGTQEFGLFGGDTVVYVADSGEVRHPKWNYIVKPRPLDGDVVDVPGDQRLTALANWLTSKDNLMFARNIVNRYWAYFMGKGLVEPIDDMRATNPASNPELLDALAKDFIAHNFDVKHLMSVIMNSRVYQLSAHATKQNAADEMFYTHYLVKRLSAEQLLDAINDATGTQEKFPGLPAGTRAMQLPDPGVQSYFLDTFGRPLRDIVCECERQGEPNMSQALHLMNGDLINRKVMDPNGRVAQLLNAHKSDSDIIEELYLATFCRFPTDTEKRNALRLIAARPSRKTAVEDLMWALLNSKEFLFNH